MQGVQGYNWCVLLALVATTTTMSTTLTSTTTSITTVPKTVEMTSNKEATFKDGRGTTHTATISRITSDKITLKIESEPVYVTLSMDDPVKKVDADRDGTYDLLVTLRKLYSSSADVMFQQISEEYTVEEDTTPAPTPAPKPEAVPEPEPAPEPEVAPATDVEDEEGSSALIWTVVIILLVIIIAVAIYYFVPKSKKR